MNFDALTRDGRIAILDASDPGVEAGLFAAARRAKRDAGKSETLPRALIETSNVCAKDCLYCGIRRGNGAVARYRLSEAEVLRAVDAAQSAGFGAVAFQAGEIESEANTHFFERVIRHCAAAGLEVTLSLGEQTEGVYRRWKDAMGAGVLRYLLRIETSNRRLFAAIHPPECSFERRLGCLRTLKRLGYVTGSGVMVALPGQTTGDLADDLEFFAQERLDMIGMGPFIPAPATPLGASAPNPRALELTLRMIALARLELRSVNIVAATALEALDPARGQSRGLAAGANVVMPRFTPDAHRADYALYPFASVEG